MASQLLLSLYQPALHNLFFLHPKIFVPSSTQHLFFRDSRVDDLTLNEEPVQFWLQRVKWFLNLWKLIFFYAALCGLTQMDSNRGIQACAIVDHSRLVGGFSHRLCDRARHFIDYLLAVCPQAGRPPCHDQAYLPDGKKGSG